MPSSAHSSTIFRKRSNVHDALPAVHLVARAEHALRVADVRALDLDDVGQARRAVAPGREQQPADRLGVGRQQPLGDSRARVWTPRDLIILDCRVGSSCWREVLDDARQDLVEVDGRLVADQRANLAEMSGTRRGMSSKPAS